MNHLDGKKQRQPATTSRRKSTTGSTPSSCRTLLVMACLTARIDWRRHGVTSLSSSKSPTTWRNSRTRRMKCAFAHILNPPQHHDGAFRKAYSTHSNVIVHRQSSARWYSPFNLQQPPPAPPPHTNKHDKEEEEEEEAWMLRPEQEEFYLQGNTPDFRVLTMYSIPPQGLTEYGSHDEVVVSSRLEVEAGNMTLPLALQMLDPQEYPSLSRARKACRKGAILVHRGPLPNSTQHEAATNTTWSSPFSKDNPACLRGRVDTRVYPHDTIGKQVRVKGGFYPALNYRQPTSFVLPVVYQDDYFAIVNKPAGVMTYSQRNLAKQQPKGSPKTTTHNLRSALPFVLHPPSHQIKSILRRPQPVHRLDKPTSGCVLVAKTKPAHVELSRQFVQRKIQKTYWAVVNGVPCIGRDEQEVVESVGGGSGGGGAAIRGLTAEEVLEVYGVHVKVTPPDALETTTSLQEERRKQPQKRQEEDKAAREWHPIVQPLEGKSACTLWRAVRYAPCLKAKDEMLTLVELKPKTGRFHQLRRHMAWVCDTPLVGDKQYDGNFPTAVDLRQRGLMLCSTNIVLEHPHYNTNEGRKDWEAANIHNERNANTDGGEEEKPTKEKKKNLASGEAQVWYDEATDKVMVSASVPLPHKFDALLNHEEGRYYKHRQKEKVE